MWGKARLFGAGILLSLFVSTLSQTIECPSGGFPFKFPSSCSCLFLPSGTRNYADSSSCADGDLVVLQSGSSTGDYKLLQRYVTRLSGIGVADEFWLGYQYNASTLELNDRTGAAAQSFLTNETNFNDTGVSAGAGVCVTIGRTGLFQRRQCSDLYRSACSVAYTAVPQATYTVDDATLAIPTLICSGGDSRQQRVVEGYSPSEGTLMECVAETPLGTALSEAILLVPGGTAPTGTPPTITMTAIDFPDGATTKTVYNSSLLVLPSAVSVTLRCIYAVDATATWYINGIPVFDGVTPLSTTSSQLEVASLDVDGVYQCRAITDNYLSSGNGEGLFGLCRSEGVPSRTDAFLTSQSKSIILAGWNPSTNPANHEALLSYDVIWAKEADFDLSSSARREDLSPPPDLASLVEFTGLVARTRYKFALVTLGLGGESASNSTAETFGEVPKETVDKLTVKRTEDNKTLVVTWEQLKTSPPDGIITRYEVEYRDADKSDPPVNTIAISNFPVEYSALPITNIGDVNSYQVRVRACVQTQGLPSLFGCTANSAYVKVSGVTGNVPPQPLNPGNNARVIVPAVVVPVVVALVLLALIILIVGYFFYNKRSKTGHMSLPTFPETELGPTSSDDKPT